jgi:uncharacterized protein YllA (UPF0747 family)
VVLEPDWIRERCSRALARIVQAPLSDALARGETAVRAAGREPAIESRSAALLYRHGGRGRLALRAGGDGFRYDGEEGSRTAAELAAEILQEPAGWSAGALVRPLVQDSVLPVAAYVGGPGELAYLAQLGAAREAAGVPRTAAVARWSCTLVEPEVDQALASLGADLARVLATRGAELAAAAEVAPPEVVARLREIAARAARELVERKPELAEIDRGLAANLPRTAAQVRSLVDKICEKAERVHANRAGRGKRIVRRALGSLCPRGELQERVLGALPFVARHGTAWIDDLFAELGPFERGHLVARFEGAALEDGR